MKKIIIYFVFIFSLFGFYKAQNVFAFAGGDGTSLNPYIITTCAELQDMNSNLGAHYKLGNNIDCDVAPYNTGDGFTPIGDWSTRFVGSLDGRGHVISGLYIDTSNTFGPAGLFGSVEGGVVKNIGLEDFLIEDGGSDSAGLIVYTVGATMVENVYVSGVINSPGNSVGGGLIADIDSLTVVKNSYSNVTINTDFAFNCGGLAGQVVGYLYNSYAVGSVSEECGNVIGNDISAEIGNTFGINLPLVAYGSAPITLVALADLYQTDPLHVVYTNDTYTSSWDFENIWKFKDGSSLPVFRTYYNLSFDSQGGTSVVEMEDVESGESVTLPNAPTKDGWVFTAWNIEPDGSGTSYGAGASYIMPEEHFTLYAIWEEAIPEPPPAPGNQSGSQAVGGTQFGCKDSNASNYNFFSKHDQSLCVYSANQISNSIGVLCGQSILWVGSRNSCVVDLQSILTSKGFNPGIVDGIFGKITLSAVKAFQGGMNFIVDGIVGPQTWGGLK